MGCYTPIIENQMDDNVEKDFEIVEGLGFPPKESKTGFRDLGFWDSGFRA